MPIQWSRRAPPQSGEATFAVPKDAYAGTYQIFVNDKLTPRAKEAQERPAGSFRVEAFRVPLLRARMQPVGVPLVNPPDVNIDLQVSYLAGGGAGGLPVTLRTQIEPKQVTFADFDDYALPRATSRKAARNKATRRRASTATRLPIRTWTTGQRRRAGSQAATRHRPAADARRCRRCARNGQDRGQAERSRAISSPSSNTAIPMARR